MKAKKWIIGAVVALVATGAYGSYRYHNTVNQNRAVPVRQVKKRVSYLNHSSDGHHVGQLRLIKNAKAPKLNNAKAAIAMDAKTGQILYQKNPNQPRKVASVAKLMTLYLVEQKANRIHGWNQVVKATQAPQLRKMSRRQDVGGFKFKRGRHYTVKDLFKAALIQSSNNSAIALGEWVADSNRAFINMMNDQAKAWHINAHFISASGLENDDLKKYGLRIAGGANSGNLLSAKAVAVIAQHFLTQHPNVIKVSRLSSAKVDGQTVNNVNNLLPGKYFARRNLPVDGLKTGLTPDAGYCFVGTVHPKHKDRLITVVLHDEKDMNDTRSLMYFIKNHSRA